MGTYQKKLKIATFHLAFIYSGGGERLVLEEARGLRRLGHDVMIFTPVINREKCFPDVINEFSIKTFIPHIPMFIPGHESFQVLLTCVLAPFFAFKFRNFDVILAANQPSPWIAFFVKKFYKVPYVSYLAQPTRFLYPRKVDNQTGLVFSKKATTSLSAKLMERFKKFIFWADRVSIKASNVVLANGEHARKMLEKTYGIKAISCPAGAYPAKQIRSIKERLRGNLVINKRRLTKPYLLITNRHFPQKRFEFAILTLAVLLKDFPNLSLVITGAETDYTREIKALAKRLNLNAKVIFLGLVPEMNLGKLYSNAVAYLYTAPEEDFGMGIIEAMAHGTPVVAWNNAGPSKIIQDGETGLLAKPYNLSDFTDKVTRILSDQKLAEKLSKQGWEIVKKKFSYESHVQSLEKRFMIEARGSYA